MRDILELLGSHRSVRKFTNRPLEDDLLRRLLDAARQAPTSSNLQPYSIIVVRDAARKKQLSRWCSDQAWVEHCPVFLVLCPDLYRLSEVCRLRGYKMQDRYIELSIVAIVDTALVAQNLAVAAESQGLGICMIGGIRNHPAEVSDLLKLPKQVFPIMGFCLGYPDHEPMIKPRLPHDAVVHYEQYSDAGLNEHLAAYDATLKAIGLYDGAHRKLAAPDGRETPDTDYSWTEHTSRRVASVKPETLRVHMRRFLEERGIGLE